MDYGTNPGEVHIYDVAPDADINEDYIEKLGFSLNTCSWMFSPRLDIIHHKGVLK